LMFVGGRRHQWYHPISMDDRPDVSNMLTRTLDYALAPTAWQRRVRRFRRWSGITVIFICVGLAIVLLPKRYRRWQLLRMQDASLRADLPRNQRVYESDSAEARALISRRSEYYWNGYDGAARPDARWMQLSKQTDPAWACAGAASRTSATVFLHERLTPSGRKRLVVVEMLPRIHGPMMRVQIIEPATWTAGARLLTAELLHMRGEGVFGFVQLADAGISVGSGRQMYSGQFDPSDPSRFSIPFCYLGVAGEVDCRLGDDDHVTADIAKAYLERVTAALNAARAGSGAAR